MTPLEGLASQTLAPTQSGDSNVVTLQAGERLTSARSGPLYCPYHNRWGEVAYRLEGHFEHRPLTIHASSTSGSPVIEDSWGRFVGVLGFSSDQPEAVRFIAERDRLSVVNDGTEPIDLWVSDESAASGQHWRHYNRALAKRLPSPTPGPEFWEQPEYCTWVEQKWCTMTTGRPGGPKMALSDEFIDQYIDRIAQMNLPTGKLTIDAGWQNDSSSYGDWLPNPDRFPDLGRTAERIADAGFVPGLWLAPVWIHPDSEAAGLWPHAVGEKIAPSNEDAPNAGGWNYWEPIEEMSERLTAVFARLYGQGFRKFKLDMSYARMDLMIRLHERIYKAIKSVAPDAEVETHQPNPFFAVHTDVVRTNDVLCHDRQDWRRLTTDHFEVSERSAFGKVINLDHIGGNDPSVSEADFLDHLAMYQQAVGYPVVSLLPDRVGDAAIEATRELMWSRVHEPNAVSRFF